MPDGVTNIGRPGAEINQEVLVFANKKPSELDGQTFTRIQSSIIRGSDTGLIEIADDDEGLPYALFISTNSSKIFSDNIERLLDEIQDSDNERLADMVDPDRWQLNGRIEGKVAGGMRPMAEADQRVTVQLNSVPTDALTSGGDINAEVKEKIQRLLYRKFDEADINGVSSSLGAAEVNVVLDSNMVNNTEVQVIHSAVKAVSDQMLEDIGIRQTIIEGI